MITLEEKKLNKIDNGASTVSVSRVKMKDGRFMLEVVDLGLGFYYVSTHDEIYENSIESVRERSNLSKKAFSNFSINSVEKDKFSFNREEKTRLINHNKKNYDGEYDSKYNA